MNSFTYMADFGFIKNATKVENVVSKKLSKLATSGKMVSSDSNIRNSALKTYNALKQTTRDIGKSRNYRKY